MSASTQSRLVPCDSCGHPASPGHIRERIERLQLGTRYRPIHISLLLVCTAPEPEPGDDFYAWERQAAGAGARAYITALLQCAGVEMSDNKSPADQLNEFQRRGVYLARLVECPLQGGDDAEELASRYGPVFLKRVQYSYKPRHIALLEPAAPGLAEQLRAAGFGERLVADGQAIRIPGGNDARTVARVRALFASCDAGH